VQGAAVTSSTQITSNGQPLPRDGAQFARRDAELLKQPVGDRYLFSDAPRHAGDGGDRRHSQRQSARRRPEATDRGRKQADVAPAPPADKATPTATSIS